jgi:hypothetical protein
MASMAVAADKPARIRYQAPAGFAGHVWGDLRTSFPKLPAKPTGIGTSWMQPVVTERRITCTGDCDINEILFSVMERREGGGYYMLTEYEAPDQGFQWGSDTRLQFYPIVYQFCANWWGAKTVTAKNFNEYEKFCGVKLTFYNETVEQLRRLPPDHTTTYDLVLEKLLAKFGKPERGFMKRGKVIIETADDGTFMQAYDRKFRTYRWCPAFDRRLHTPCEASVTLTLDPVSGIGAVLYSTKVLWQYAYAQQNFGEKGDPLFKILHARAR